MGNGIKLAYMNEKGMLFNADCLELLKNMKSDSVSCVFTDPPFNLGKNYETAKYNDSMDKDTYMKWCHNWLAELIRVLKPGGTLAIYLWPKLAIELGAWLNTNPYIEYRSLIALKMKSGFPYRGRLHPAHYSILYYVKKGAKPIFNVVRQKTPVCRHCGKEVRDYGGYRKKFVKFEDKKGVPWIQISDLWEDTRPARADKSRNLDINELPIHIPERIILMGSNKNDVVLDIFGGGGSTYHAAQTHGRYWIGCEIGNIEPILSRFATVFGRDEANDFPKKLTECFRKEFMVQITAEKNKTKNRPITKAEILTNGHSMSEEDVVSKSKVLGF